MKTPQKQLGTDFCDVCGRERPAAAISTHKGLRYCNDDHNDTRCHIRVKALAKEQA